MISSDRFSLREKCPYSEFFWSVISRIWTKYREIRSISPYSAQMRKNTDQILNRYYFCQWQKSILKFWLSLSARPRKRLFNKYFDIIFKLFHFILPNLRLPMKNSFSVRQFWQNLNIYFDKYNKTCRNPTEPYVSTTFNHRN